MPHAVLHSSLELLWLLIMRPQTLPVLWEPAPPSEVNERICWICSISKRRRGARTRTDRSRTRHNNPRPSKMTQVLLQHHHRWKETLSHPLHHRDSTSNSTHHHLQIDTCIQPHHHHSSIYHNVIRSLYSKILIWMQHYSRWPSSTTLWHKSKLDKSPWEHHQCLILCLHSGLYTHIWQGCMHWVATEM